MARPQKEGLDYFPLDTDMDLKDDKIQLVEAKYGITGFGVLVKLLMKIFGEGYYYQWGENEGLLFSKRVNVDNNIVNDIVNDLVKWGMFDGDIFGRYGVLTSNGIQKRFWEVAKRRNDVIINKAFWIHNVDIILISANISLINVDTGTHRKGKNRKGKESKEEVLPCACKSIIDYLNQKAGTQYRHSGAKTKDLIKARFNEGFTEQDFFKVIDNKCDEWLNDNKMVKFLRPETLFSNKFEGYLNQKTVKSKPKVAEWKQSFWDDPDYDGPIGRGDPDET